MCTHQNVEKLLEAHNINLDISQERYKAHSTGQNGLIIYDTSANQKSPLNSQDYNLQKYFYRAMTFEEASAWITVWNNRKTSDIANSNIDMLKETFSLSTGIHLASCMDYSMEYITNQSENKIMLEFDAPELISHFNEIGVYQKSESKDMSYGIGHQASYRNKSKNDFGKSFNKVIDERYTLIQNSAIATTLMNQWIKNPNKPKPPTTEDKFTILKVIYFLQDIKNIRVVCVVNN